MPGDAPSWHYLGADVLCHPLEEDHAQLGTEEAEINREGNQLTFEVASAGGPRKSMHACIALSDWHATFISN